MNIAVLGAGNGGQTTAGHLALMGHSVALYNRAHPVEDREILRPLQERMSVQLEGVLSGTGRLNLVTNEIAEAVRDRDLIIMTFPAVGHLPIAEALSPHLKSGQIVVVHPGQIGTAWRLSRAFENEKRGISLVVTYSLLYACRQITPGRVKVHAVKEHLLCSAYPGTSTPEALTVLRQLFPQLTAAANVLEVEISNMNTVVHPAIVFSNLTAVDNGTSFEFYSDGVSRATAKLIKAIDRERMRIVEALGIKTLSAEEFLVEAYGLTRQPLEEMLKTNHAYQGIPAPKSLDHRYVWEDVACGLVPLLALAEKMEIQVPLIRAVVTLFTTLLPMEPSSIRDESWLGISTLSREELIKLAHR